MILNPTGRNRQYKVDEQMTSYYDMWYEENSDRREVDGVGSGQGKALLRGITCELTPKGWVVNHIRKEFYGLKLEGNTRQPFF